jgi:lactose/L-arabinose transport system permease protein
MLADPTWMKPVLIIALLWRWTGNDMVIMLAGLQSIPGDLYEAARVDGASGPQMFWHITVPLMRPVILFDAIISTIGTFNLFAEPFVLFGQNGGPGQAGMVTGTLLYQNAFVYFKFGYGAALAWVLALIIFVLSMLQLKLGSREEDREKWVRMLVLHQDPASSRALGMTRLPSNSSHGSARPMS